jgi:hypothetical protein
VMTADGPRFGPQYQQIEYKSLYTRWLLGETIPWHIAHYYEIWTAETRKAEAESRRLTALWDEKRKQYKL